MNASWLDRYIWLGLYIGTSLISLGASAATPQVDGLIADFQAERTFYRQLDIGNELLSVAAQRDLTPLEPWLDHRDRHIRGNVAYLFARKGDARGLDVLLNLLSDGSGERAVHFWGVSRIVEDVDRPETLEATPEAVAQQIRQDRYYAVHLLGELKDPRAVPALLSLLDDGDVSYKVAWALGEIGDSRAIPGLIGALSNPDALVRVCAIGALQSLRATQALPHLTALFNDGAIPNAGDQIPVSVTARKAAAAIHAGSVAP